jgi:predicted RNA binding protein YcfA (HicA-like mRNA interferase family)
MFHLHQKLLFLACKFFIKFRNNVQCIFIKNMEKNYGTANTWLNHDGFLLSYLTKGNKMQNIYMHLFICFITGKGSHTFTEITVKGSHMFTKITGKGSHMFTEITVKGSHMFTKITGKGSHMFSDVTTLSCYICKHVTIFSSYFCKHVTIFSGYFVYLFSHHHRLIKM